LRSLVDLTLLRHLEENRSRDRNGFLLDIKEGKRERDSEKERRGQTVVKKIDPFVVSIVVVLAIDINIARLNIHHSHFYGKILT
jgi:hypothetical protein